MRHSESAQERGRYRSRTHTASRFVAQQLMLKPLIWSVCDVHVAGQERISTLEDPFIVVANHSSHLDGPLIIGSLPRRLSRYLATGVAADYFFEQWWKRVPTALFFNAFPIERGKGLRGRGKSPKASRRGLAGHLLNDGVPLLIFPEGTRSKTKAMRRFTPGFASLAISRNVPALPIALVGAGLAMPRDTSWPKRGRPPVHVIFGEPVWARPDETANQLTERVQGQIRAMHDETARAVGLPTMAEYAESARTTADQPTTEPEQPVEPVDLPSIIVAQQRPDAADQGLPSEADPEHGSLPAEPGQAPPRETAQHPPATAGIGTPGPATAGIGTPGSAAADGPAFPSVTEAVSPARDEESR